MKFDPDELTPPDANNLYGRRARVIVGENVNNPSAAFPTNTVQINTRIAFMATKSDTSDPNCAKISVFNLSKTTRGFLEHKDLVVWLQVGYGAHLETVFYGDLRKVKPVKRGGDIITELECYDGKSRLESAIVSIGFGPNCTNAQVLEEVRRQLNIRTAKIVPLPSYTYKNGLTKSAMAYTILNELTRQFDYKWSIQDGELQVLPRTEPFSTEEIVLNPNTGLIGIPCKTERRSVITQGRVLAFVEARSAMNTRIRPGRLVSLSYEDVSNMRLKVQKVDYAGDSQEGSFECRLEGLPLGRENV